MGFEPIPEVARLDFQRFLKHIVAHGAIEST